MKESFGITSDGTEVDLYTLRNVHGLEARITNYGGILVSLIVPDRKGEMSDVVLGFDNLEGYLNEHPCFGAIVGRYANRIAAGVVTLEGRTYQLTRNDGENHLHGGMKGFDKVVWLAAERESMHGPALGLRYVSSGGEEGYPGTMTVDVTYTLTNENELKIDYTAVTDRTTVINLTQHSYFNLRDAGRRRGGRGRQRVRRLHRQSDGEEVRQDRSARREITTANVNRTRRRCGSPRRSAAPRTRH